jgi:hypothetical protein
LDYDQRVRLAIDCREDIGRALRGQESPIFGDDVDIWSLDFRVLGQSWFGCCGVAPCPAGDRASTDALGNPRQQETTGPRELGGRYEDSS